MEETHFVPHRNIYMYTTRSSFLLEQFYKNEAQICPKIKNKLRTIEARLQMQI